MLFCYPERKGKNRSKKLGKKHSVGLQTTELSCPDFSATKTFLMKHERAVSLRPPSLSAGSRADSVGRETRGGARPQEFRGGDSSHNNRTRAQAGWHCHTHSVNHQVGTRRGAPGRRRAPGRRHQPRRAKQEEPPAQEVAPTLGRPLRVCRARAALRPPGRCRLSQKFRSSAALSVRGDGAHNASQQTPGAGAQSPGRARGGCAGGAGSARSPAGMGRRGGRGGAEPLSRKPWKSCSASHQEQPALRRPPRASRRPGWGLTHLGQAAPVLGVLPAQHLLQLVHPEPVCAAAARPPPPVALLRPRPFRVRAPPRCLPTWPPLAQAPGGSRLPPSHRRLLPACLAQGVGSEGRSGT